MEALEGKLAAGTLRICMPLFLPGLAMPLVSRLVPDRTVAGMMIVVGPLLSYLAAFLLYSMQVVGPEDYYSLPLSRSSSGEHRCVFCGGPGIYRHGEYANSVVFAQCSRCREDLFQENGVSFKHVPVWIGLSYASLLGLAGSLFAGGTDLWAGHPIYFWELLGSIALLAASFFWGCMLASRARWRAQHQLI